MTNVLTFRNLPFTPAQGQVIYIEPKYDGDTNAFIVDNYEWLIKEFSQYNLDFCYLPLLAEEAIIYNAPSIEPHQLKKLVAQNLSLSSYLEEDSLSGPALVFSIDSEHPNTEVIFSLPYIKFPSGSEFIKKRQLSRQARQIERIIKANDELGIPFNPIDINACEIFYSKEPTSKANIERETRALRDNTDESFCEEYKRHRKPGLFQKFKKLLEELDESHIEYEPDEEINDCIREECCSYIETSSYQADVYFDKESKILFDEIRERIHVLRKRGVNMMFLHDLIDETNVISPLRITKDYRLFLPAYNDMEIKMSILPKAVFILFLRHPEGIRFKELSNHYEELLAIYKSMSPKGSKDKISKSIRDIVDPCNNSINEKCARIREAFVSQFNERLAYNYYISGQRGEPKRIPLDRKIVTWE